MKSIAFAIFSLIILTFYGCANAKEAISISTTHFNTYITITIYDSTDTSLLSDCVALLDSYDKIFSLTKEDSELYQLNLNYTPGKPCKLSYDLASLVKTGMEYTIKSQGAFSITLNPLTSLWEFGSGEGKVPSDKSIAAALKNISYEDVIVSEDTITFMKEGMGLDLGGISKGYIADRLKEFLISKGVKSALINLGGNILCVGGKPDGKDFTIGIKRPFGQPDEVTATIKVRDKSVVSSGIYERYFTVNNRHYHHLLDTSTGFPIENELAGVTIISPHSVDGDALSTTCFVLGLEKGLKYLESLPDVDGIFVDKEGQVYYTDDSLVY